MSETTNNTTTTTTTTPTTTTDDNKKRNVSFNNEIEIKTIENEQPQPQQKKVTNDSFLNEDEIKRQIEIANEKQRKRDEEFKKKNKIEDLSKEHKYKEEIVNGQIDSVQGEKKYGIDEEEHRIQQENQYFKKVKGRRAFKNDDELSDDDEEDSKMKINKRNEDSDSDSEDDDKEEDKNEIEIDSFNLESENQEGYFDESGNFIFKKHEREKDAWLEEYDKVWSSKLPKVSKGELKRQNDQQTEEEEDLWEIEHQEELKKRRMGLSNDEKSLRLERLNKIYNILQSDKESILSALRRLSGNTTGTNKRPEIKRKNPPKNQRTKTTSTSTSTTTTSTTTTPVQSESDKKLFNQLTELADTLLNGGYVNIYSETKQSISATFKKESYEPLS